MVELLNMRKRYWRVSRRRKLLPFLSKESIELIPDITRLIYIINLNIMLYPPRSEMIVIPLEELFKKLSEIFVRDEVVMFSEVKEALVINRERPKGLNLKKKFEELFLSFLRTHGIGTLCLKRGLTKAEFSTFIEVINDKVTADRSLSDLVRSKGLFNIEVEDITYELTDKKKKTGEREQLEEAMLIDYLLGKVSGGTDGAKEKDLSKQLEIHSQEIADAITRIGEMAVENNQGKKNIQADVVAKSFQKIGSQIVDKNPQDWEKQKKSLVKTIMKLEPRLRNDVLLSEKIPVLKDKKDIIKDLIPEFSDEVIVDLLTEEFEKERTSSTKMKCLVQKFLAVPEQRQRMLSLLKDKFIRKGLSKDEVGWIFAERRWKDFGFKERIKRFLEMSAYEYLNLEEEIKIESLILDIVSQDSDDILIKVLNKWKEFLNIEDVDGRLQVAKATQRIILSIPPFKHEVFSTFIGFLCDRLDKENEIDVYTIIINLIAQRAVSLLNKKDFIPAKIIIQRINKISTAGKSFKQQKSLQELKENIIQLQRLKMIIEELFRRVDGSSDYSDILELISEIGDPMVDLLIEEAMIESKVLSSLGYFGAFLRRGAIGGILSKLISKVGNDKVIKGLNSGLSSPKWHIVKNTIELFMYLRDQDLVKFLEPLLYHSNLNIRNRLIFVLGRLKGKDSIRLLVKALKDKDKTVCLHAIRVLGNIGDKAVLAALKKCIQSK